MPNFCYKSLVKIATGFFFFAGVVTEGNAIAVTDVVLQHSRKPGDVPNNATDKRKKAAKPTEKLKNDGGTKIMEKL